MSGGVYNQTYFDNRPLEKEREGVLYGVILVNQKTFERECIKVGIASGKDWRRMSSANEQTRMPLPTVFYNRIWTVSRLCSSGETTNYTL